MPSPAYYSQMDKSDMYIYKCIYFHMTRLHDRDKLSRMSQSLNLPLHLHGTKQWDRVRSATTSIIVDPYTQVRYKNIGERIGLHIL